MRHCIAAAFILIFVWGTNASAVSLESYNLTDPEGVVTAYFQCLSEGDIGSLTSLIGGNLLERKKRMLSNVDHYSTFLRNHYKNSQLLSISQNQIEDNKVRVVMEVLKQDGVASFVLILSKIDNLWIITDDITH